MASSFLEWSESIDSFLAEIARLSDRADPQLLATVPQGSRVADRYRLQRQLGRGAYGVVWLAEDELTSAEVAVKLVVAGSPVHAARIRAEVASLRSMRAPGVVRLVDEGVEEGLVFMVMPFIRGEPFPGCALPATWSRIERCARQLLEALSAIHAAGIVHRDLKPANVLVGSDGAPVVLDFGLSLPAFANSRDGSVEPAGTPAYLAPEQITEPSRVDARADLYAVGGMLYQAITGRLPHEGTHLRALLTAKADAPTPIRELAPSVPAEVASTIDALLATDPADRPASAAETLRRFAEAPQRPAVVEGAWPTSLRASDRRSLTTETIAELFVQARSEPPATEAIARLLFARTGGAPSAIREQVADWLKRGLCRWATDREAQILVSASTLDHMEAQVWLDDSRHAATLTAVAVCEAARAIAAEGSLGVATAILLDRLSALRAEKTPAVSDLERVLGLLVEIAFCERSLHVMDRVLFEICRTGSPSAQVDRLEQLVRARLSVGPWTERALELASRLEPFVQIELELLRQTTRVIAARRTSLAREEQVLDELTAWVADRPAPAVQGTYAGWLGKLRYRQGRFAEAAALHRRASESPLWQVVRGTSLMNAASASMEAFDLEEAASLAEQARAMLGACRNVTGEAQAGWFVRTIAYRRGLADRADERNVEPFIRLAMRDLEGLAYLTEGAIAWRAGELELGRSLAERGRQVWDELGETAGAGLMTAALAIACAPAETTKLREVRALRERALRCDTPGVGVQVLALLARLEPSEGRCEAAAGLADQVPREHWRGRIDIMSVEEALYLCQQVGRSRTHGGAND